MCTSIQYFSLSDLLHSVWQTLGPSTSLLITLWGPFRLWSGPIPACARPQSPQLPELDRFHLWEHLLSTQIVHRCRVYLAQQLVQLMERFLIFFLSRPIPGVQLGFYPHLCVWSIHRSLVLRLPWSSCVCPSEDRAWRWYDCLDHGSPDSARCAGKPAATGARDVALVRAFSGTQCMARQGQPWLGFFWRPAAGVLGPSLRGLFFIASRQVLAWGGREAARVACPPACDSAVAPCFHGSPVFLCRYSLLQISSLPSPQSVSPQPTATLAPGLFSSPRAPAPSPLAHLWTHVPVQGT